MQITIFDQPDILYEIVKLLDWPTILNLIKVNLRAFHIFTTTERLKSTYIPIKELYVYHITNKFIHTYWVSPHEPVNFNNLFIDSEWKPFDSYTTCSSYIFHELINRGYSNWNNNLDYWIINSAYSNRWDLVWAIVIYGDYSFGKHGLPVFRTISYFKKVDILICMLNYDGICFEGQEGDIVSCFIEATRLDWVLKVLKDNRFVFDLLLCLRAVQSAIRSQQSEILLVLLQDSRFKNALIAFRAFTEAQRLNYENLVGLIRTQLGEFLHQKYR